MKVLVATLALALTGGTASGQAPAATSAPIEIDDLRAPTSPSFALLDITPASVQRPESAKAFVLNLLSTVSRSEGLPKSYALQVAPYWLMSHPTLTFGEYQAPSLAQSMLRTMSVSVATSPLLDTSTAEVVTVGTRIGLGVITTIVGGRPNPTLRTKLDELEAINKKLLDAPTDQSLRAEARKVALGIQGLDQRRVGFLVTAAAGQAWSVPQDDIERQQRDRWGFWVTPAYRFLVCRAAQPCKSAVDAIAVVRAIRDRDRDTQWDIGGRLLWQPNDPFTISTEFVRRLGQERGGSSDRTVAIVEYRIREDMLLFGSFGKDFKADGSRPTLVSILGLSFGFGAKPTARPTP